MRDHPLVQLTLARMREFYREPEAIFWVFGFPIVLAFALGIAFRDPQLAGPAVADRGAAPDGRFGAGRGAGPRSRPDRHGARQRRGAARAPDWSRRPARDPG